MSEPNEDDFKTAMSPGLDRALNTLVPGLLMDGRYRLQKFLGRGGFGVVWLAYDEQLRMEVAVKLLSDLVIDNPEAVEDLKLETKNSLRLTHPNIVRIYGFFQSPQAAGIVMEYIDGGTLSALKAQRDPRCFDPAELIPWLRDLCGALDYAHQRVRIVHRDLKPGNLMVDGRGELKVADFGIARSISDTYSKLTNMHRTAGTLAYMSPQQLMGQAAKVADDIYSLGATVYDLVAGKPPFYTGDVTEQIRRVDPPRLLERRRELGYPDRELPPQWEETIAACLSKDPAERPQSAGRVAEMLGLRVGAVPPEDSGSRTVAIWSNAGGPEPPSFQSASDPGASRPGASQASQRDVELGSIPQSVPAMATGSARRSEPRSEQSADRRGAPESISVAAAHAAAGSAGRLANPTRKPAVLWIAAGVLILAVLGLGGLWLKGRGSGGAERTRTLAATETRSTNGNRPDDQATDRSSGESPGRSSDQSTDPSSAPSSVRPSSPSTGGRASENNDENRGALAGSRAADASREAGPNPSSPVTERTRSVADEPGAHPARSGDAPSVVRGESRTGEHGGPAVSSGSSEPAARKTHDSEPGAAPPSDAAARPAETQKATPSTGGAANSSPISPPAEDPATRSAADQAQPQASSESEIRDVIAAYVRACEQLNFDLYARLRPSLSGAERDKLRGSFNDIKEQSLSLGEPAITVNGNRASVAFREKRTVVPKAGTSSTVERQVTMEMEHSPGGTWVIRSVRYQ